MDERWNGKTMQGEPTEQAEQGGLGATEASRPEVEPSSNGEHSGEDAAERFAANRRYDYRPAIENVDRPVLVFTTRDSASEPSGSSLPLFAMLGGLALLAFGAGAFFGLRMLPVDDVSVVGGSRLFFATADEVLGETAEVPTSADGLTSSNAGAADAAANAGAVDAEVGNAATTGASAVDVNDALTPEELLAADRGGRSVLEGDDDAAFLSQLESLDLDVLTFVSGGIDPTPEGIEALGELAEVLLAHPGQSVELRVRAYSESTPGRNHGLSVHQANVLKSMLTEAGVGDGRISVVGIGSPKLDRPAAAAALFFDSSNDAVHQELSSLGPIVLEEPFEGSFDQDSLGLLVEAAAIADGSSLLLVGYSWDAETEALNHDQSHELLDAASRALAALGVPAEQVSSVGLGSEAVPLAERTTVVSVVGGSSAGLAVLLAAVAVDAVSFEPGTATLTQMGTETLGDVAQSLQAHEDVQIEVAVHFYGRATSQANHDASQLHAAAIGDYLREIGVPAERLRLVAHGDPPHFAVPGRQGHVTFTVVRP